MVLIPAGTFLMGCDDAHWPDQRPRHAVHVAAFYIDRYPVTNADYLRFVLATGRHPPAHWPAGPEPWGSSAQGRLPVVNLTWHDACAYARWAGKRLPTEAEWEKAAAWDPVRQVSRAYPWGDAWAPGRCNIGGSGLTPVGAFSPAGDAALGVADMAGNVWEWCSSLNAPYPYQGDDGREDADPDAWRILRGGAWDTVLPRDARCTFRHAFPACFALPSFGCRLAVSASEAAPILATCPSFATGG